MTPQILYQEEAGLGRITIDHAAGRNALTFAMQRQFAALIARLSADPPPLLLITGAGTQAFAAGGDLKELAAHHTKADGEQLTTIMREPLDQLTRLPTLVIGVINGDAAGGGVEILSACDLRLAVPHARLHFAQVKNGVISGWGGAARLLYQLGQSRTAGYLLTGRTIEVAEALQIGFVHAILAEPDTPLERQVDRWLEPLQALPQAAVCAQKQLLWHGYHRQGAHHAAEKEAFVALFGEADHREALYAFREKRPPQFNRPAGDNT